MSKKDMIEKLLNGESIKGHREGGNSMTPLIKHRQPVNLDPVDTSKLTKGDMVFVKVKGRFYTHKVTGLRKNQVQIGNNHGGINGWTNLDNVYGIVTKVDGRQITSALSKVKIIEEVSIDIQNLIKKALIGLSYDDAVLKLEEVDIIYRVAVIDGEHKALTMDLHSDRVNLIVDNNLITSAYLG